MRVGQAIAWRIEAARHGGSVLSRAGRSASADRREGDGVIADEWPASFA